MDDNCQKNKILIADDTEFFRVLLGDVLKAEGYEVLYAADGRETLRIISTWGDELLLLIMDMVMPELDGKEVLEELQRSSYQAEFPILIMTGYKRNPDEIRELRRLGIDGFISKSEPPRFFVARIKQALNK